MKKDGEIPNATVIVTVKDESQSISILLDSLETQTAVPKEIIIVDGGSTDGTIEIIKRRMIRNKKIRLIVRRGVSIAKGRNIGILNSNSNIIVTTDAGCVVDKNWLFNITRPFLTKPKIGIVTGLYKMRGRSLFQEAIKPYLGIPHKLITSSNFLPSARSMALRKSVWKKIGGFPEDLKGTGEDTLFNYKAISKGIKFYLEKNAIVDWKVPQNLTEFVKKLYNYSKGDAQTEIWWHSEKKLMTHNIKIMAIYFRYLVGLIFLSLSLIWLVFLKILIYLILLYITWIILKNYHQVEKKSAIILSPIIQIVSDIAVMSGFAYGILSKL